MRTLKIGGVILVTVLCGTGCVALYLRVHDRTAEKMLQATIPLIDAFREQRGALPASLDALSSRPKFRLLGVLPAPRLNYWVKDGSYRVDYYQLPFGPFYGYNSGTHDWTYEE
jgi:hypothetical protein